MTVLLVEAGETWLFPFDRVSKIEPNDRLQPYAFEIEGLEGLLPVNQTLVPVWRPAEFSGTASVVLIYYGNEGLAGLHVSQVLGVREIEETAVAHGEWLPVRGGQRGRWFDIDDFERRLMGSAVSGGLNAEEDSTR
jgi:hypothetical protein